MFAVIKDKYGIGLRTDNIPEPIQPGPGEVQVKVTHAGVCGTDYHIYKWDKWSKQRVELPRVIGHEFCGEVVKLGEGVDHVKIGQRVSAECHITCGRCLFCRSGKGHLCQSAQIIGVDRDGAFAEFVNIPASNVWQIPDGIKSEHAAIFDPIGNAMHAVEAANVAGRSVVISGAGPIGLLSVAICKHLGARHISVIEPQPHKRDLARKLGADLAVIPEDHANERIHEEVGGPGPRIILEMSGNPEAIKNAFKLVHHGGTVVLMGIPSREIELDVAEDIIFKALTVQGVVGRRMFETWDQVEKFVTKHPEAIDAVISHIMPASEYQEAFTMMEKGECNKVVLTFE